MMTNTVKVFLDTSVIIAAVLSKTGGARKLFRLGEAGIIALSVGPNVLRECQSVVSRKVPESLPTLARVLDLGNADITEEPSPENLARAFNLVAYRPDAYVLAEALQSGPDWFVTHDKAHFLKPSTLSPAPFWIGTPGDVLQALKQQWGF